MPKWFSRGIKGPVVDPESGLGPILRVKSRIDYSTPEGMIPSYDMDRCHIAKRRMSVPSMPRKPPQSKLLVPLQPRAASPVFQEPGFNVDDSNNDQGRVRAASSVRPPMTVPITERWARLTEALRLAGNPNKDILKWETVQRLSELDSLKRSERRQAQFKIIKDPFRRRFDGALFGRDCLSLHDILKFSPITTITGGATVEIPLLIHATVEAIYNAGLDDPQLFRRTPNERHVQVMKDEYSKAPNFGGLFPVSDEQQADVSSIFIQFMNRLGKAGDPLIGQPYSAALWEWVVKPSRNHASRRGSTGFGHGNKLGKRPVPLVPSVASDFDDFETPFEKAAISVTRHLLRLLPTSHFALLTYVMTFFTQIPEESNLRAGDLSRMFGGDLCAGRDIKEAQETACWVLERWHIISEGLIAGDSFEAGVDVFISDNEPIESHEPEHHIAVPRESIILKNSSPRSVDSKMRLNAECETHPRALVREVPVYRMDDVKAPHDSYYDSQVGEVAMAHYQMDSAAPSSPAPIKIEVVEIQINGNAEVHTPNPSEGLFEERSFTSDTIASQYDDEGYEEIPIDDDATVRGVEQNLNSNKDEELFKASELMKLTALKLANAISDKNLIEAKLDDALTSLKDAEYAKRRAQGDCKALERRLGQVEGMLFRRTQELQDVERQRQEDSKLLQNLRAAFARH